jgi:hypothetical protein
MKRNYFRTMFLCVIASIIILVCTALFKSSPLVAMVAGVCPLIYYHLFFLRPQASMGLSQTAIDSVYYFGFLVTISALGISAVSIAVGGSADNLNTVIYQFGAGLFATGYAIVARMHLSSISTMIDEASPEAIMDRYVARSIELVTNVEMASEQLTVLSTNIMKRTAEVTETAQRTVERTMLDAAKAFESEMKLSLETARDTLTTIRGLVNDASFVAERKELALSIAATVDATTLLNQALAELTARSRESTQATQQTALTSEKLDETLCKFAVHINELGGEEGALIHSADSLRIASQTIVVCNESMAVAAESLSDIAGVVADTGSTFKSMRTLTKKASEQLESLANASDMLESATSKFVNAAVATDSLAVGMSKVSAALSPLAISSEALSTRLDTVGEVSVRLEQQLLTLPKHISVLKDMGDEVADFLDQICSVMEDAVVHSKAISANTAESSKTMEAATKLLDSSNGLQHTISSLQQQFVGLSGTVADAQKAMLDSSSSIKVSITRSTDALEADANRSSKAASLLTEKLIQVAQNVIDRTKQPETV